ncbi:hypothetical protein CH373_02215 [Leptospira perolatii]|uniref:Uncharacterized protein n=1 Tax=Leptospira perolatii TaxID=2023191 RepID=A0A2M9ZSY8_9LEPT|nr:hypothetical protein CH360_02215 [Leptospira perolatii]PJZ75208.1 hypothetical protein CH373_02215 [Leptospira perolatii]
MIKFLSGFLVCLVLISRPTFAQVQSDFSDPYDYNLRNYKEDGAEGGFKDYSLPPKFEKPSLVTPKNAQIPFSNPLPLPGSAQGVRRTVNPVQNRGDEELFNPITGEVNTNLIQSRAAKAQERKRKMDEFGKEEEPYTETRFRRFSIIFFLTLPIAAALSYGTVSLAGHGYQKTFEGGLWIFGAAFSLSFANAWVDLRDYDKMKLENQPEAPVPDPTSPDKLSRVIHQIPGYRYDSFSQVSESKLELQILRASF